jgi:hypothetical protein
MSGRHYEIAKTVHAARRALCHHLSTFGGPAWDELGKDRQDILCAQVAHQIIRPDTDAQGQYELFIALAREQGLRLSLAWDALPAPCRAEFALFAPIVAGMTR